MAIVLAQNLSWKSQKKQPNLMIADAWLSLIDFLSESLIQPVKLNG